MTKTISILLLLTISFLAKAQDSPKQIIDTFFEKYQNDQMQGVDYIFSTSKYLDSKSDVVINLKNKLRNLIELCGQYKGYEILTEASLGQCMKSTSFIVKYERQPIRFYFLFYKASDKWVVQDFSFDSDLDDDIEAALKQKTLNSIK